MKCSLFILCCLCFNVGYTQTNDSDLYTIYLVRHAEKEVEAGNSNPALTSCGKQRAETLAGFFNAIDLMAIYSTNYVRTRETASPTAKEQQLKIQDYNPRKLKEFAVLLKERKEDALVVGHSNTTAVLAGLLIGEEMGSFDESIYNRIYQVVLSKDQGRLHILNSSFVCAVR